MKAYIETFFLKNKESKLFCDENTKKSTSNTQFEQPSQIKFQKLQSIIENLQEIDSPVLFGLPLNIDKTIQRSKMQDFIELLKTLNKESQEEITFQKEKWAS